MAFDADMDVVVLWRSFDIHVLCISPPFFLLEDCFALFLPFFFPPATHSLSLSHFPFFSHPI